MPAPPPAPPASPHRRPAHRRGDPSGTHLRPAGWVGRRWTAVSAWVVGWLGRPLTSLHLVLGVFGLLTAFGLVMVLSASSVESFTTGGSSYSVFTRQLVFCGIGLPVFYLGLRIPPARWRACAPTILLAAVVLMIAVLLPGIGVIRNGSRGWIA